jgi:hypothetical protein
VLQEEAALNECASGTQLLNECCGKRPVRQLVPRARGEEGHQETQAEECRKIVFALNECLSVRQVNS